MWNGQRCSMVTGEIPAQVIAFFWHQVPAKQLILRHKRHEPICKPYSEQYTMTIMSWFLIQKHWKKLESFEGQLLSSSQIFLKAKASLETAMTALISFRLFNDKQIFSYAGWGKTRHLEVENSKKQPDWKKQIHGARCKKSKCSGSLFCFHDHFSRLHNVTNKFHQMIMSTWPSKPKHLGFDEAEGFCSGAAGAAVVSGGAVSSCSPC